jgi:hypothetical protein
MIESILGIRRPAEHDLDTRILQDRVEHGSAVAQPHHGKPVGLENSAMPVNWHFDFNLDRRT